MPPHAARPSGRRFGILVHALLAAAPFDASAQDIRDLAEVQARMLGAINLERAAASSIVDRVLRHKVIAEATAALAAGRGCRREAPVSIVLDPSTPSTAPRPAGPGQGGVLVDGQVDLAYETPDEWVVVDFKTDIELSGAEELYRRQVALYVMAVARATGKPARGVLLRV